MLQSHIIQLYSYILSCFFVVVVVVAFFLWGGELHFIKGELTEVIAGNFERN